MTLAIRKNQVELGLYNRDTLLEIISQGNELFLQNEFVKQLSKNKIAMSDYHSLLNMIYHQTFYGPGTFAIAGAFCPEDKTLLKNYLLHHAEEEKTHYTWVLNDLKNTGYQGTMPNDLFPKEPTQAYIAFNYYIAQKMPVARLGIAAMLENIGANCGKKYAQKVCELLKLEPNQATFFFGHGDTDVKHTAEILEVMDKSHFSENDWKWTCYAAETAAKMYKRMYDEVVTSKK